MSQNIGIKYIFKKVKGFQNLLLFIALSFPIFLWSQTIPCDHKAYLSGGEFRDLNIKNLQSNQISSSQEFQVNAMGYNVQDEKIYGMEANTFNLLSIDGDGNVEDLGIPQGLDLDFNYIAGDVAPEGKRMIVIAQNESTGIDERLYTIRLEPPYNAGFVSITSIENVGLGDITFDPLLDKAYGYDNRQKKVVSLALGGNVTSFATANTPHVISSLFFDEFGVLYGVENGKLIEFNKHTGEVISAASIVGGELDGCSCPYQLEFFQIINPPQTVPCSEVIITYYFDNRAGSAYGEIGVEHNFPDGFTITEIIEKPFFGTVENGVGSSVFEVSNMQVLLGVDSFSIRVYLDETVSGNYDLQANSFYFPQAFGTEIKSDNPYTIERADPTNLEIITEEADLFPDEILYLCEGGELTLTTNFQGVDFLWNNGSTEPNLTITEPGEYWVEIKSDCEVYRDYIQVEFEETPLFINLGEDIILNYGQTQSLSYSSSSDNISFQWDSNFPEYLSCNTCPNPIIQPLENSEYSVTITNENGCTATDDILVKVKGEIQIYAPNIFSPNGDGINDQFFLQSGGEFEVENLKIFNRWGNLVFQKSNFSINDPFSGWNGKIDGKVPTEAVYLWTAEIEVLESIRKFSGSVLLLKN